MAERRKRKKSWAKSFGDYGTTVWVFESNGRGSILYARVNGRRQSLGHRNKERATQWAKETAANLALGVDVSNDTVPRVDYVCSLYLEHETPNHTAAVQQHDARCAELWTRVLGPQCDLSGLTLEDWQGFAKARRTGAIDPRGHAVPTGNRRTAGPRTVGRDQEWLRRVLLWAGKWRVNGRPVLDANPMHGFPIAREKNPRRPVASEDRYEATRAVSDNIMMDVRQNRCRIKVRSYLGEILDIINGTGRRLTPVIQLRFSDLRLTEGPHGAICWPADTDKKTKEWSAPINESVRQAIDRIIAERPGVGAAYLFPSPRNARRPVSGDTASRWLLKAEKQADLPKLDGSLWHAYRRKWATSRKGLPDVDVAAAGGWSDLTSLKTAYQQPDTATLYRVVSEPTELREVR